ncbi:MAG: hypothetical protein KJO87_08160 [Acidimicrobiia bacterium]|nr:hypothetical protein [Acidimicrobiia bacterium]
MRSRLTRRRLVVTGAALVLLTGCAGQPYEPSFETVRQTLYADGIPDGQERALADGLLTEQELTAAIDASNRCVAAIPGIELTEPYRWVPQDGDFDGGNVDLNPGADEETALAAAEACYVEHVALIEYAWLDQFYFGSWAQE